MSSFKGVPMNKVYRSGNQWDLNHLPPIQNQRNHFVLFDLPIAQDSKSPPKPHRSETKWDAYHVKLPCAPQNDYKTESAVCIDTKFIFLEYFFSHQMLIIQ